MKISSVRARTEQRDATISPASDRFYKAPEKSVNELRRGSVCVVTVAKLPASVPTPSEELAVIWVKAQALVPPRAVKVTHQRQLLYANSHTPQRQPVFQQKLANASECFDPSCHRARAGHTNCIPKQKAPRFSAPQQSGPIRLRSPRRAFH